MAHGDSKKLQALKALTTLLEGITPVNQYDFSLSGKVFRGRGIFGDEQVTPFISILENPEPDRVPEVSGQDRNVRSEMWQLQVQGWTEVDAKNPTDILYNLMAAVENRLNLLLTSGQEYYRLNGLISDARIGPGAVYATTPAFAGRECFALPLQLRITVSLADPWNPSSRQL